MLLRALKLKIFFNRGEILNKAFTHNPYFGTSLLFLTTSYVYDALHPDQILF